MTHGIVIGRFMPLHAGHIALIRTASALVDRLTIILCWHADDEIPGAERVEWVKETFPALRVVACETPSASLAAGLQTGAERLAAQISHLHADKVDRLIAAEREQEAIAFALGARFTLIDPDHEAVPLRSADIGADAFSHWGFLPPAVRPSYASTICLHGPESTGKSTLARRLAAHFGTLYVPEYGRTYCEQFGLSLAMEDLVTIGRTHQAMTKAMLRQCERRLFLDTDPLMTAVWADMLFQRRDRWFDAFTDTADLYLLLDIDMPWIDDGTRFFGDLHERRHFFDLSRAELERRGLPYQVISGSPEERFAQALAAISQARL
ncbi:AAA family ATPase [Sphingomonas crusticola]|uniref:AAA family ATPase n=1 Tax=Sphingomonas crusticola TaxID=1697973 RepID=UPI0013C2D0FA|nr:AAA family ATPase [Sphingomonas crusticola]